MEELLKQYYEITKQLRDDADRLTSLRPNDGYSSLEVAYTMNDITEELQMLTTLMQKISVAVFVSR